MLSNKTYLEESIKELKRLLFVHAAHKIFPCLSNTHGTELERTDTDTSCRAEDPVSTELGLGLGRWLEQVRHFD